MANALLYYLLVINILTFAVYGIDKWRSTSGRLLPTGRKKAKQASWRISETTLLMLAVIGGTIGALLGMQEWLYPWWPSVHRTVQSRAVRPYALHYWLRNLLAHEGIY